MRRRIKPKSTNVAILLFLLSLTIYFLSSPGNTPHDYFTRLGAAFLEGRYWLSQNPPWLNELIPTSGGRFYVAYPPMPAIISMPFVFISGKAFPQQYLAHLLGAGIVALTIKLSLLIKKDKKLSLWIGTLVGFGTINWFLASVGSAWYLGQLTSGFFLLAALVESLDKKRPIMVGILLGAAYLSRIHTILSLPLFLYLLRSHRKGLKAYLMLGVGLTPFLAFNSLYNFTRFSVVWDKAYLLIPGILEEPWFSKGLFHPSYIHKNLKVAFASLPVFTKDFPYILPSWNGLAIWFTTPALIYSLRAQWKEGVVKLSWVAILLIALVVLAHGTWGFAQFGYRFAVDFYPLLVFLVIKGVARTGLRWHHWVLLTISIIVNFWGVLWINKFGWVTW